MLSDIRLQHFRSYDEAVFELSPGVTIVVGPNGSGKTNLLEALLVVSRGGSYRVRDAELIQYDQPWARLDATADGDKRTVKLVADPPAKTYEIDGRIYKRLMPAKMLPTVVFEPNHLTMLTGSPELRRSYLDDLLEQTELGYTRVRRDYKRALAQRNALLKRLGERAKAEMFPWDVRLSQLGGEMVSKRLELLQTINDGASELYGSLADKPSQVGLQYQTKLHSENYASSFLQALEQSFDLDVLRGFTAAGPHREDISVLLNGHSSQISASRGETRTAILMLKVMELRLIERARGISPLLLLDDVFSELDGARRQALTNYLQDYQTCITTTDADVVIEHFRERCNVIRLG